MHMHSFSSFLNIFRPRNDTARYASYGRNYTHNLYIYDLAFLDIQPGGPSGMLDLMTLMSDL